MSGDVDYILSRDQQIEKGVAALKENVAAATQEQLGISNLLEEMRQVHLIPTGCFGSAPVWDWVHIYQLGPADIKELYATYAGTNIVMPETVRDYKRDEACRGILLAAGPAALDSLRTNGIEVGHTVRFCKFTPFRLLADYVASKEIWYLAMRAESIESSETLEQERRAKKKSVAWDLTHQMHVVADEDGNVLGSPQTPWDKR